MRPASVAALVLFAGGCAEGTATVIVELVEPARCAEFCVEELTVTFRGATIGPTACGAELRISDVPTGEEHRLYVTAKTRVGELRAEGTLSAIDGERVAVDLAFAPSERPQIDAVVRERDILIGPTDVTIEGVHFGDEPATLTIGGKPPTMISAWSDAEIIATVDEVGDLVVSRCGVSSEPFPSAFIPLDISVLEPLPSSCPMARMVGASAVYDAALPDAPYGLFECAACDSGLVAAMEGDVFETHWAISGCPSHISAADFSRPFLVRDGELAQCELVAGRPADCRARNERDVTAVSAIGELNAAFIRTTTAGAAVYVSNQGGTDRIAIDGPIGVDRRLVLAKNRSGAKLMSWRGTADHAIDLDVSLGCLDPRLIASNVLGGSGARRIIAVVCARDGGSEVRAFDLMTMSDGPIATVVVRSFVTDAVQLSRDGSTVVLWSRGSATQVGTLAFVDLARGEISARRRLPTAYAGAAFVRAQSSNTYYLGGPMPGQVTRIRLP